MNKQYSFRNFCAGLFVAASMICAPTAQAALQDLGNGIILDTDLGIEWLADANYSRTSGYNTTGVMTWNAANKWVDQLNVGGYNDWRLPTIDEFSHLFYDELDGVGSWSIYAIHNNTNFALFKSIQNDLYWTDTPANDTGKQLIFNFNGGYSITASESAGLYATAVRAVTAVPEPEAYAMLLGGLGLMGFMARRRKISFR